MDAYNVSEPSAPDAVRGAPDSGRERDRGTSGSRVRLARKGAQRTHFQAAPAAGTWIHDAVFDYMDQGVSVIDRDLRVVAFNQRFLALLEFPPERFHAGDPLAAFFRYNAERGDYGPGDPDTQVRDRVQLARRFEAHCFERTRPDGTTIEVRGRPLPQGGFVTLYTDVTVRRAAEQQLRLQSAALQSLATGVVITDRAGDIVWANPAFSDMTGYTLDEIRGRNPRFLKSGVQSTEQYAELWATITAGDPWRGELVNRRKDGSIYCEEQVITPIRGARGEISHFVAVKENIDERKQLQAQLVQAQKLESIGQLAAGIAHEINTPIQYVGDNLSFLQGSFGDLLALVERYQRVLESAHDGPATPALIDDVEQALADLDWAFLTKEIPAATAQAIYGAQQVTQIVSAMKEFSHPGGDHKEMTDINRVVENTATVARNEWKYVAELVTDLDPQLPLVPCLRGELGQVVLNLLVNAAHAVGEVVGDDGAQRGTITVTTRQAGSHVQLSVADTGAGIPAAIRERIFDPFFTTKPVGKGTGQGLAIARAMVVNKHGGTIEVDSEEGRGTRITLRLPLANGETPNAP